jgi:hypothetical protein
MRWLPLLLLCACAGGGASPGADAGSCVKLPSSCPSTNAPSYAKDIAPLVQAKCLPCHSPGKVAASRDFTTYTNFSRWESTAFVQVGSCLMPPSDAGPDGDLSIDERTELLQWFVCGAQNN